MAPDARQILVFQFLARLGGLGICDGEHGVGVDGRVAHDAFEGVVGIRAAEVGETRD